MPDSHNGNELTTLRLGMLANGYRPVPVSGPECQCKDAGKRPLMTAWQTDCATATPTLIREWTGTERNSTNTGILAGEVAGIDIDVPVPELADGLEDLGREMLGETPLWRVGSPPKRLGVYRMDTRFGKLKTPELFMPDGTKVQVEILADGQQFVAFGIHPGDGTPETRRPYQWRDKTPLNVPVDELPAIDGDTARQFIAAAEQLLRQAGAVPKKKEPTKPNGPVPPGPRANRIPQGKVEGESFFHAVNRLALTDLEAWVPQLFPTAIRQAGTGAWRVSSRDLGRNFEEDLSIHPDGIQDFGPEEKPTPVNLVIQSGKARDVVTAAHWLCDRLGINPRDYGWSEPRTVREPRGKEQTTPPPEQDAPPREAYAETGDRPQRRSVDLRQFLKMDLPPREMILAPWLPSQAIALLVGFRGVGKTHVGLGMAHAIATASDFLRWTAPKPRTVLYIDGEMAADDVQTRLQEIEEASGIETAPDRFHLITPDLWGGPIPDLSSPEGQADLEPELDGIDVVFIDNLSCLCRSGAENERESWLPVQDWALGLRRRGKSVVFMHHVNKNGGQRGTSGREDTLDAVLYLDRPADYTIDQGCRFIARFDKARIRDTSKLAQFEARLISHPNGYSVWSWDESAPSKAATTPDLGTHQLKVLNVVRSAGTVGLSNRDWELKSAEKGVERKATFYECKKYLLRRGLVEEIDGRFIAT